jgi:hypothetical protein
MLTQFNFLHQLSHLPEEKLAKLEDAESLWNAGWSYGKEKLSAEPDVSKGRFVLRLQLLRSSVNTAANVFSTSVHILDCDRVLGYQICGPDDCADRLVLPFVCCAVQFLWQPFVRPTCVRRSPQDQFVCIP